jgi:hypothetical protein
MSWRPHYLVIESIHCWNNLATMTTMTTMATSSHRRSSYTGPSTRIPFLSLYNIIIITHIHLDTHTHPLTHPSIHPSHPSWPLTSSRTTASHSSIPLRKSPRQRQSLPVAITVECPSESFIHYSPELALSLPKCVFLGPQSCGKSSL